MILRIAIALLVLGALAAAGYVAWLALGTFRRARAVSGRPVGSVRAVTGGHGRVTVQGDARPVDDTETLRSPFTDTPCLAYTYRAEEHVDSTTPFDAPRSDDGNYQILDEGREAVPFLVDDGTDRLCVEPGGADLLLAEDTHQHYPWRTLPDPIREYVDSTPAVERAPVHRNRLLTFLLENDKRFVEGHLAAGETVSVRGEIRRDPGRSGGTPGDGPVLRATTIADATTRATSFRYVKRGLTYLLQAVGLAVVAGVVTYGVFLR